jgi:beta-lactamase class A
LTAATVLALPYLNYRREAGYIPAWVRLGGLEVHGATEADVVAALERGIEEPIEAWYGEERLLLRPEAIGFRVNMLAILREARAQDLPQLLVRYLVERSLERDLRTVEIPLHYDVDMTALDAWLAAIAAERDRAPGAPAPNLETMTLAPGKPGMRLDILASKPLILEALARPADRSVRLVVAETPALAMDVRALQSLLEARIEQFPGIGSIYVHFLPTGEEALVNADVAYAGTSTLKIPILAQLYRKLDGPPLPDTRKIISETMMHSGNFTANLMLGIIGDGDWDRGVQVMNQSFKVLGMKNTFMASPYDRKLATTPNIRTEANQRTDLNTQPDPYMQTTPREIGSALQMLVACAEGGGALIAAYEDAVQPHECQQLLEYMTLNEMSELLLGGLPPGTKAVHKHGYVPDTHGDVAAIWSSKGAYILSVFLYRPYWLEWHISNPTMQEISRATFNFFENQYEGP